MITAVLGLAFLLMSALGAPQQKTATKAPIKIISQTNVHNADGSYEWSYETENGIKFQEKGTLIPADDPEDGFVVAVEGSVTYELDGKAITLTYTADKSGFQAKGDHLPTPLPVPEAIQQGLDLINSQSSPKPATNTHTEKPKTNVKVKFARKLVNQILGTS